METTRNPGRLTGVLPPVLVIIAILAPSSPLAAEEARATNGTTVSNGTSLPTHLGPAETIFWGREGLFRKGGRVPVTSEGRQEELKLRRGLLTAHWVGGVVTTGLLISAVGVGEGMYEDPRTTREMLPVHRGLVLASVSTYSVTALLAAFSPPPLLRRPGFSTMTLHRILSVIHFTGMILNPILGILQGQSKNPADLRSLHQVVGITTASALGLSMVVLAF